MNKFKIGDRAKVLAASNNIPNYSDHVGREYDVIDVSHYGDVKLSHSIFYHDPSWLEIVPDKLPDTPDTVDMFISDWKAQSLHLATTTDMKWRAIARQLNVPESSNRYWLTSQIDSKKEWDKRKVEARVDKVVSEMLSSLQAKAAPKPTPERLKKLQGFKDMADAGYARGKVKPTILIIADTQCKPTESLDYMTWIGKYIADKQPDIVVMIGDLYDFPSLSSYDIGKKSAEGRRLSDDIEAGNLGLSELTKYFKDGYSPRLVFTLGNHEIRLDRYVEDNPNLSGTLGTEFLPLAENGWEVVPFLTPIEIEGIFFCHYLANPMTGKPYAGSAANILKTVGRSFVVGHKQVLDVAIRPTIDGKQQIGIVNGAAYPFFEDYKGVSGNNHFRGLTVLHEVQDGFGSPMFVSLDYLKNKYED